jgi:hypothetical protein
VLCVHGGTLPALAYAWRDWRRAYEVWRRDDRERLRAAIVADSMATEGLRDAVRRRYAAGGAGGDGEVAVWERELDDKQAQLRAAMARLGGEAAAARLDAELARARGIPADERIAHEIIVDLDGFLLRMKAERVPGAVWERLAAELAAEPAPATHELFARFDKLERELNGMRPGSLSPVDRVELTLDAGFAVTFLGRVVAALKLSQAEADDAAVDAWLAESTQRIVQAEGAEFVRVVVEVLRDLTDRVARVHEVVSMARVLAVAPIVQQHGAAWERTRHEERVRAGEIDVNLPRTRLFLSAGRGHCAVGAPCQLEPRALLRAAIVRACEAPAAVTAETVPEVFVLDVHRLVELQNDMQRAALLALLDNVARQFLASRSVPIVSAAPLRMESTRRVLHDDSARLEGIQDSVVAAVAAAAVVASHSFSAADESLLRGIVERAVQPGDAMFQLLHSRVSKRLCSLVLAGEGGQAEAATPGLESADSDISALARRIETLATWAWNVHGPTLVALALTLPGEARPGRPLPMEL